MRVLKFGGTSLSHPQRLETVLDRLRELTRGESAEPVVVVVSALGGVTDELTQALAAAERGEPSPGLARRLRARHLEDPGGRLDSEASAALGAQLDRWLRELDSMLDGVCQLGESPPGVRHRVLATGERLAAPRVAAWLRAGGVPATPVDGTEVLRSDFDLSHPAACAGPAIDSRQTRRQVLTGLAPLVRGEVPVVTGFLAAEARGRTVTLGRGASDLSATTLAAALEADRVEIWTDTDGVLSADPRRVAEAHPLRALSFDEAAALARYGAKVLHPETLAPVRALGTPVELRSTFAPRLPGTRLAPAPGGEESPGSAPLEGAARASSCVDVVGLELSAHEAMPLGSTVLGVLEDSRLEPLHFARSRGRVVLWLRADESAAFEAALERRLRPLRAGIRRRDDLAAVALLPGGEPASWLVGDVARRLEERGMRVHDLYVDRADASLVVTLVDRRAADGAVRTIHETWVAASSGRAAA
ncbi:MAG: aspartate kinase [Acidobacteriota bacterium]